MPSLRRSSRLSANNNNNGVKMTSTRVTRSKTRPSTSTTKRQPNNKNNKKKSSRTLCRTVTNDCCPDNRDDKKNTKRLSKPKPKPTTKKTTKRKQPSSKPPSQSQRKRPKTNNNNKKTSTYHRQKKSLWVTPSPNPEKISRPKMMEPYDSTAISSCKKKLRSSTSKTTTTKLPEGVYNIDVVHSCCQSSNKAVVRRVGSCGGCIHEADHNHPSTTNEAYLSNYGKDYADYLHQGENEPFPKYSITESLSSSTSTDEDSETSISSSSSSSSSSAISNCWECDSNITPSISASEDSMSCDWASPPPSSTCSSSVSSLSISPSIKPQNNHNFSNNKQNKKPTLLKSIKVQKTITKTKKETHDGKAVDTPTLHDYMERQPDLSPEMRKILIDWLIELTEEYNITSKTLHTAISLVDRSLASVMDVFDDYSSEGSESDSLLRGFLIPRESLQCVGCACMLIASKLEETSGPTVDDFVYISDSSYTRKEITKMELRICSSLCFHLRYITPFDFVDRFLRASSASSQQALCCTQPTHPTCKFMVQYLLELAAMSYDLVAKPPSMIAASAVFLARATLGICDPQENDARAWSKTLCHYTGYSVCELQETVRIIFEAQKNAEQSDLKSIFTKYKARKYERIALKTVLNDDQLLFATY